LGEHEYAIGVIRIRRVPQTHGRKRQPGAGGEMLAALAASVCVMMRL
jgi:hypothetical protein